MIAILFEKVGAIVIAIPFEKVGEMAIALLWRYIFFLKSSGILCIFMRSRFISIWN